SDRGKSCEKVCHAIPESEVVHHRGSYRRLGKNAENAFFRWRRVRSDLSTGQEIITLDKELLPSGQQGQLFPHFDLPVKGSVMSISAINVRNQFRGTVKAIIEGPVVSEVD